LTAVAVASLAALATSCFEPKDVFRLAVVDGRLYVGAAYSEWPSDPGGHGWYVYGCDADFNCEEELTEVSDDLWLALSRGNEGLVAACVDNNPLLCYRGIDEQVEFSADGGQTWQIIWQIPPGRREYMERISACKRLEAGMNDLLIISDDEQEYIVVLAMGNEGILIRWADDNWERKRVGWETEPTPFAAESIFSLATHEEFVRWAQFWVVLLLSTYGLRWIENKAVLTLLTVIGIAVLFTGIASYGVYALFYFISDLTYLALLSLAVILSWRWLLFDPGGYKRRPFWFWLLGIIVGFFAFAPMSLWELGTISYYETALTASIITAALAILVSVYGAALGVGQSNKSDQDTLNA
jgi:hypothetical protein